MPWSANEEITLKLYKGEEPFMDKSPFHKSFSSSLKIPLNAPFSCLLAIHSLTQTRRFLVFCVFLFSSKNNKTIIAAAFCFVAADAMFVLVANKLACARLRDLLHHKLRTILLGVATPVPKVARNVARNDASSVRAFITSTDEIHLTLMMTSAQVVETSLNVITTGPSQDYTHHTLPTYDMTPGFKPSTALW